MKSLSTFRQEYAVKTRNQKIRFWSITAAVAVVVIALLCLLLHPRGIPMLTFNSSEVTHGNIRNAVTATGTINPVTQVDVGTQVSGIVSHMYVDYNSIVKKGQLIAELDKTNLTNALEQAKATVANNQTEFNYQQKNFRRQKVLYEQGYISDLEYDQAEYNYEKAKNSLDIAQFQLKTAQTNLGYATIYSPIDGVVISKAVEEGQTVQASMSTPTLYTIAADLTAMQVIANVDEADIGEVTEGLKVVFTVDAYPGMEFTGIVKQVRQEAVTSSNVVTYEVVITTPNPDLKLKPGMTATVSILTMERENVLLIPTKALRYTPQPGPNDTVYDVEGAANKVWTREGNVFRAYAVEIGETSGSQTEILSGITEGLRIITGTSEGLPGHNGEVHETGADKQEGASSPFMPARPGSKKK